MMSIRRNQLVTGVFMVGALAVPLSTNGCSAANEIAGAACCTEFKVGADMSSVDFGVDASIKGQFGSLAQAAGDFSAVGTTMLADVESACRNIAIDLGAAEEQQKATEKLAQAPRAKAWCSLAAAQLQANAAIKAAGQLKIDFQPPQCSASVQAKASCQARCDASAACDIKATPPKCTGGRLEVACSGSCTAEVGASLTCTGECTGSCQGSCEAKPGGVVVGCDGRCEGECRGAGGAGTSGVQADGTCKGSCSGKCTARAEAPSLKCEGTCSGKCDASCKGSATAKATCDGKCDVAAEPIRCEGGKLEGGCKVEAQCDANCDASVNAKAECTPPSVRITGAGAVSADLAAQFNLARGSLEENLPRLLVTLKARAKTVTSIGGTLATSGSAIVGNAGKLGAKAGVCGVLITGAISASVENVAAAVAGATTLTGAVGIN